MLRIRVSQAIFALAALAAIGTLSSRIASAQVSDWPMTGQNRQHTGFTLNVGPSSPQKEWISGNGAMPVVLGANAIYSLGDGLRSIGFDGSVHWRWPASLLHTPAVGDDGTVYVAGYSGTLTAINPSNPDVNEANGYLGNSAVKWSYTAGDQIAGSPTIAPDGSIVFTSNDKYLYHLEPNGTLRRRLAPAGNAKFDRTAAIALDGTIHAIATDNNLYAYKADGTLKWKYKASPSPNDPIVGNDGTVYLTTNDFTLWAIAPNGSKRWSVAIGTKPKGDSSACWNQPGLDPIAQTICVGGRDGLYGYSYNGVQKWKLLTPGRTGRFSRPAIDGAGTIYITRSDTWNLPVNASVYAVNSTNGVQRWTETIGAWSEIDPVIDVDGSLYVSGGGLIRYRDGGRERPTIHRFDLRAVGSDPPTNVLDPGETFDLRSYYVRDTNGTIAKVEYFIDEDGDGELDPEVDLKIGESTAPAAQGGSSYRLYFTPNEPGEYVFFCVATDNSGQQSNVMKATGYVLPDAP